MADGSEGYEWAVAVLRRGVVAGVTAWEYHRYWSEAAARNALREEHSRIGQGIAKTMAALLARRPKVAWEVYDEDKGWVGQ